MRGFALGAALLFVGALAERHWIPSPPEDQKAGEAFVERGIVWLVQAQHPDGGWGSGSHANQQMRDPHQVQTDPATTAFTAMALVRAGSTPESGTHRDAVRRATEYLVRSVENHPEAGPLITDITGTQPQSKLGPLVDTAATAQFLVRVAPTLKKDSDLGRRADAALNRCLAKLQTSQLQDGSWNVQGGWAPVLQSSLFTSALEMAQASGKEVDERILARARAYQKGNYDAKAGRVEAGAAAGVPLYAFSSAQRATAAEAGAARDLVESAKTRGDLPKDAEVSAANLEKVGVGEKRAASLADSYTASNDQLRKLEDEQLMSGFGSNGGEEYLSYLQASESLVIAGGNEWEAWKQKMGGRLQKIQSADGSWTGHHCITSPVFCTAAVVQCLMADRDRATLRKAARAAANTK